MANIVEHELSQLLFDELQKERFMTLTTIDNASGEPIVNAISWALAKDKKTIILTVAGRSKIVENIRLNKMALLTIIANESVYSISGEAIVKQEGIEDVPLKLVLIELRISEVREVMFYGSKIIHEPHFEKIYDQVAAENLDKKIMNAMKKEGI